MIRTVRILVTAIAILLALYFVVFAFNTLNWAALRQAVSSTEMVVVVLIAAILYACIVPVTGWAWSILLTSRGEVWRTQELCVVLGLSQLAKYIPGNVAQHAARATMSSRKGMGLTSFISSVTQETVLATAASVLVGLIALIASGTGVGILEARHANILATAGITFMVAVIVMSICRGRTEQAGQSPLGRFFAALTTLPGAKATGMALSAYSLNYVLIGAGLWLVARALNDPGGLSYLSVIAAFSLSWLLGFMTPGAPAGLGTREGIMLLLLHGAASAETLATFVLLARLVTMLGDVVCFLGAAGLQWWIGRQGVQA